MDGTTHLFEERIRRKYKSVRAFAAEAGIPYTTLKSALGKGMAGMAAETFFDLCDRLDIDLRTFSKKNAPSAGGGGEREKLLSDIVSLLEQMDGEQLSRYRVLVRYAYLPEGEFLRLTELLALAKLPPPEI